MIYGGFFYIRTISVFINFAGNVSCQVVKFNKLMLWGKLVGLKISLPGRKHGL